MHAIRPRGEKEVQLRSFLTSAQCGLCGQLHAPTATLPGTVFPVLPAISGWVDPRTGQEVSEEKNALSLAVMEKFLGRRARSLVTTPAELSLFHYCHVALK